MRTKFTMLVKEVHFHFLKKKRMSMGRVERAIAVPPRVRSVELNMAAVARSDSPGSFGKRSPYFMHPRSTNIPRAARIFICFYYSWARPTFSLFRTLVTSNATDSPANRMHSQTPSGIFVSAFERIRNLRY